MYFAQRIWKHLLTHPPEADRAVGRCGDEDALRQRRLVPHLARLLLQRRRGRHLYVPNARAVVQKRSELADVQWVAVVPHEQAAIGVDGSGL